MNEEDSERDREEEEEGGKVYSKPRRRRRRSSLTNGAADLLSEIRYSSLSIISYLFGEGAVASSAPIPS